MASVHILDDGSVSFEGIAPQLLHILGRMHEATESGSPDVEERLFPAPVHESTDDHIAEDWKAFVEPDLQAEFLSARAAVTADLRGAEKMADGNFIFRIPQKHLDLWLNALTQSRLALASLHHFTEDDMNRSSGDLDNPREFALMQSGIYGSMLEWLVSIVD
jgi:hypothetical protein